MHHRPECRAPRGGHGRIHVPRRGAVPLTGGWDFGLRRSSVLRNVGQFAGMRRISLDLSPPFPLTIHADGYVAITSNTLQFGAQVWLTADIGIASGEAGLGFDALFRWAPRLFFEADINAQISIKAFGETFANIQFTGHLQGTRPWRIEATATVDVWYLPTVHFDVGPFQWGDDDETPGPAISPQQIVSDAMKPDQAWAPILPSGADTLVRFKKDDSTVLLAHPLGGVQVRQIKVPLEIQIDHIGKNSVTAHRVNLTSPKLGTKTDAVVSDVRELFAVADFLKLSDDDSLSRPGFELRPAGAQLTATSSPVSGAPKDADYKWDTIFPGEPTLKKVLYSQSFAGICSTVLRSGPVASAARARGNAYTVPANPIQLSPAGMKEIRRASDLGVVTGVTARTTTAEAAQVLANLRRVTGGTADLEMITAGVAP